MPPRSVKMNRFIFGFQRRVWWPKWTPASSRSFMETTGMERPFLGLDCLSAGGFEAGTSAYSPQAQATVRREDPPGRWVGSHEMLAVYPVGTRRFALLAVAVVAAALAAGAAHAANPRVLVFTKTAGFRHDSIPAAIQAVRDLG